MKIIGNYKREIISTGISLLLFSCVLEEIPDEITFEKHFGGTANDAGYSVQQTHDLGYIITGYTESKGKGGMDVYLIKTDANGEIVKTNGNIVFEKTFGGHADDVGNAVQQTQDGGYIITGYTANTGAGGRDVYLIKTDEDGNIEFEKTFGGEGSLRIGNSVQQTQDGGYIITGLTAIWTEDFNVYLIKTDANGNIVFEQTFGGPFNDVGNAVQETLDGGYIITGYTVKAGRSDLYLIKTDADGNKVFEKTLGGSIQDVGNAMQQTKDGGYIITGFTRSTGAGELDVYLIKTDNNGDIVKTNGIKVFVKTFGEISDDIGFAVQQTQDEGYIITGFTATGAGGSDVYLIKTNANGDVVQ